MDDRQFQQLLDYFELSYQGYRKVRKGVKKRISRHMQQLGCKRMATYLRTLEDDPKARLECQRRLTVSISRFFRDYQFWVTLEQEIFPALISNHPKTIKVWSAGCACGQEVYSFKMVWDRLNNIFASFPKLKITATDSNSDYLEKAQAGLYTHSSLKEIPDEIRTVYFDKKSGTKLFAVKPFLKQDITWKEHNLLSEPPNSVFHIIALRNNVLTYYQDHLQKAAFKKILSRLACPGFFIVGSHEKLPFNSSNLKRYAPFVYRQKNRS